MTVEQLIEILKGLPKDSEVSRRFDGIIITLNNGDNFISITL